MYFMITTFVLIFSVIYLFLRKKYSYWNNKNVPHLKPVPFLGNYSGLLYLNCTIGQLEQRICQELSDAPLVGSYLGTEPCLIVQDPKYVKIVTTKDFYYFSSREISEHIHNERLSKNLFLTYGDTWKVLRQNLTPTFTSTKMKAMFHLIEQCSRTFEKVLDDETQINDVIEVRCLIGRFTIDCIGICAFGLDTRALTEYGKNNPFTNIGDAIFTPSYNTFLKKFLRSAWPHLFYFLGFKALSEENANFFTKLLIGIFQERQGKQSTRNDFVDLIMNFYENKYITGDKMTNLKGDGKDRITLDVDDDTLSAQCFVFFVAGHETSSSTISYTLFELAKHPDVQERVRSEIDEYLRRHNGILGYECVSELPLLEQCVDETLRLYPVLGVITREVIEPYRFPDTNITVEKGMRIHLPIYHIHHNPKYFPDPEKYRPERFSPEEKKNIVPYSYLPFGEGPRICIGMRFAKMQMYAGLVTILKKYKMELAEGMPAKIEFQPKSMLTQSKCGINLKLIPRTDSNSMKYSK